LPFPLASDPDAYDRWFRSKVQEALEDSRPPVPQEQVEAYFTRRRFAAREKATRRTK
jgi:DNA-damage-inducible protein J